MLPRIITLWEMHMHNALKRLGQAFIISGVILLCVSCSPRSDAQNLQISSTKAIEVPDSVYTFTANNLPLHTQQECTEIVECLASIFNVEVDWESSSYEEERGLTSSLFNGGSITAYTHACVYVNTGKLACALDTTARRVALIEAFGDEWYSTYQLAGVEYSPAEAVSFFEELWASSLSTFSSAEEIKAESVIVYEREDGSINYVLLFSKCYNGVAIEQFSTFGQSTQGQNFFRKSFILVEMSGPGHIYHYADYYPYQVIEQAEIETPLLGQEEAIELAAVKLAQYSTYKVEKTSFCYGCFTQPEDSTFDFRPYWCFVLKEQDHADGCDNYRPNITLFIDAQDGTAYFVDSISYTAIEIS